MTRRRKKDRQRDRKARNAAEAVKLFEPGSSDKPANWSRLRQRFTTLTQRRRPVLDGLAFTGMVVVAGDPNELVAETRRVLAKLKNERR